MKFALCSIKNTHFIPLDRQMLSQDSVDLSVSQIEFTNGYYIMAINDIN